MISRRYEAKIRCKQATSRVGSQLGRLIPQSVPSYTKVVLSGCEVQYCKVCTQRSQPVNVIIWPDTRIRVLPALGHPGNGKYQLLQLALDPGLSFGSTQPVWSRSIHTN